MDFSSFSPEAKRGSTINPADLHTNYEYFSSGFYEPFPSDTTTIPNLSSQDSGVDLVSRWKVPSTTPQVKSEPMEPPIEQFLDLGESSPNSNEQSPNADIVFSQANSPGDYVRDLSQASSPDTSTGCTNHTAQPCLPDIELDSMFPTPEAISMPQTDDLSISQIDDLSISSTNGNPPDSASVSPPDALSIPAAEEAVVSPSFETPEIYLIADRTKTRAETQIKIHIILDPFPSIIEQVRFPRRTLAKPKLLSTPDEVKEIESKSKCLYLDTYLVCATAVEKPEDLKKALRRARGEEAVPKRPENVTIAELDKDDPAHPQNGGEVLICEGCKERERKRYDRKKKKAEDEQEWWTYEDERVVMINDKEFKKWKDVHEGKFDNVKFSHRAKFIDFAMRIACYCRHQEEKSPVGYRVIFTFKDFTGALVGQHTSEIFQITDDHKNKEIPPESIPQPLTIPQTYYAPNYGAPSSGMMGLYHDSFGIQFPQTHGLPIYPQPQTSITNGFSPINGTFQPPVSPIDEQFPLPTTPTARHTRQNTQTFPNASMSASNPASTSHLGRPQPLVQTQPFNHFESPMLSPNGQFSPDALHRPVSMDNFNFNAPIQYSNHQGFASAPQSAVSTPINLSRPASPTWDQGPSKKRQLHCFFWYADDGDTTQ